MPEPKQDNPSDWKFVGLVIAIVLLLTTLPYLYGYLSAPADKVFMGMMLDVPDHLQYFSWMRELSQANLAANKLTPEPNAPVFFNLLWWGLGRLDNLLGWGYAGMYQLLRVVSTILFLLLAYRMCAWFLPERLMRRTAFLIITFTSGFGWVLVVLKYTLTRGELLFPLDVYVAEGNTFLSILGYPHFVAALLYIFVFDLVLRGERAGKLRYAVFAGLVALFLGWQHTYDLIIVYGVLFAYIGLRWLRDRRLPPYPTWSLLIIGLLSFSPALYSVWLTSADPIWKEVLKQFANAGVYTPPLPRLVILFGVTFLLAIYTLLRDNPLRLQGVADNDLFIRGWFLVSFILVYLPVDYQIHMLNGWQVPMAILATQGLFKYIAPYIQMKLKQRGRDYSVGLVSLAASLVLLVLILPTNLYLWAWRFVELARHDYPYYLYKDEVAALEWLEQHVEPGDVVLSSLTIGQYVPALTGAHAFLAHWAQTVDFYDKSQLVEGFYSDSFTGQQRDSIIREYGIDYVFWGPVEQGGSSDPIKYWNKGAFLSNYVTIIPAGK
jgi:hypothetical protein